MPALALVESIDRLLLESSPASTRYVHFTDKAGADAIAKSKKLLASSYIEGVYAVAEGGTWNPGVQHTKMGRASDREWAVVFKTKLPPNMVYPEEVIWYRKSIPLSSAKVTPAKDTQRLLNGSRVVDVRGDETLKGVPWHPTTGAFEKKPWPDSLLKDVISQLDAGSKLRATKLVVDEYGLSIRDAQWFIERLLVSRA